MSVPRTLLHGSLDLVTPVPQLNGDQTASDDDVPSAAVGFHFLVGESEACPFGTGVDAQLDTVDIGLGVCAVLQPDGEGSLPGDYSPPFAEKLTSASGMARHERLSILGEDEDPGSAGTTCVRVTARGNVTVPVRCLRHCRSSDFGVTPTDPGTGPAGLPSPMCPAGAPRGGGVSVSRFVPAPRGVSVGRGASDLLSRVPQDVSDQARFRRRSGSRTLSRANLRNSSKNARVGCYSEILTPLRGGRQDPPAGRRRSPAPGCRPAASSGL